MSILWDARYETGIAAIDEDHRRLVGLINDLDSVLDGECDLTQVGMIIDALVDYTDYHFNREEEMLARVDYAELGEHEQAHARFGEFLGDMVGECILRPSRDTAARVRDYLQEWLLDHILVEDMRYVPVLRALS